MLANLLLVSNKTLWSLWHFYNFSACWLFWCFNNPPNSDMDYIIFNVSMWYFCMRIHTEDLGLYLWSHIKDFCGICTESDSCEISGRAQSLARNGHPSIDRAWLGLSRANIVVQLRATYSPEELVVYSRARNAPPPPPHTPLWSATTTWRPWRQVRGVHLSLSSSHCVRRCCTTEHASAPCLVWSSTSTWRPWRQGRGVYPSALPFHSQRVRRWWWCTTTRINVTRLQSEERRRDKGWVWTAIHLSSTCILLRVLPLLFLYNSTTEHAVPRTCCDQLERAWCGCSVLSRLAIPVPGCPSTSLCAQQYNRALSL